MEASSRSVGFIGLGSMGEPMALNLLRAGTPLLVWNRSSSKAQRLAVAGAAVANDPAELFARCGIVFLMLANGGATDSVLSRGCNPFADRVRGRLLVNMATVAPQYSRALSADINAAGGRYVEAPVSGSRKPAETGKLVAMLAGEAEDISLVRRLIAPMCRDAIECGRPPDALAMKLAINLFLITMVTGLVEAVHFAQHHGLDLAKFEAILNAGPMASDVSRMKGAKVIAGDFAVEGAIVNVLENNRLIAEAAREAQLASPLLDACHALYGEANALGLGNSDMVAVIRAVERRTASTRSESFDQVAGGAS
jgi:3-hydroxyisobutyrate dehydrogenase